MSVKGQGHLVILSKGHTNFKINFSKIVGSFKTSFHVIAYGSIRMKTYKNGRGHMNKRSALYDKKPSKMFFSRTSGLIAMKPGM